MMARVQLRLRGRGMVGHVGGRMDWGHGLSGGGIVEG